MFEFDDVFDLPFFLDRSDDSVLRRYVAAHNQEHDNFANRLEEIVQSRQIDNAQGEELDRIGAAFGILGKRRGRSDQEYRIYLKSLVQSFRGRGTVPGIISAVAAGLNIEENKVAVEEDFQNLEYTIKLYNWTNHRGSTVEELSELADASVAKLKQTEYKVDTDEMGVDDAVSASVSTRVEEEEISISDATFVNQNLVEKAEEISFDDSAFVDRNKVTVTPDEMGVSDTTQVNTNKVSVAEKASIDDNISVSTTTVTWDSGNWDTMNWAREQ